MYISSHQENQHEAIIPTVFGGGLSSPPSYRAGGHRPGSGAYGASDRAVESGVIVKVDKDAAKLTIKHSPLVNLKMPGMTMAFKVKRPEMLDQVTTGDKINFLAESLNGALTVTVLESAK